MCKVFGYNLIGSIGDCGKLEEVCFVGYLNFNFLKSLFCLKLNIFGL